MVNVLYTQGVLCGQCSRSRHCVAAMGCGDFLICFKAAMVMTLVDPLAQE